MGRSTAGVARDRTRVERARTRGSCSSARDQAARMAGPALRNRRRRTFRAREGCAVAGGDPPVVRATVVLEDEELHRLRHSRLTRGAREPTGRSGLLWRGAQGEPPLCPSDRRRRPESEKALGSLSAPITLTLSDLPSKLVEEAGVRSRPCRRSLACDGYVWTGRASASGNFRDSRTRRREWEYSRR